MQNLTCDPTLPTMHRARELGFASLGKPPMLAVLTPLAVFLVVSLASDQQGGSSRNYQSIRQSIHRAEALS